MSKKDDGQWATNIAYHRSPLYGLKGMYRGPKIEIKRKKQIEKNKERQIKKNREKQIERDKERQKRIEKHREKQKQIENIPSEFKIPYDFKTPYEFKGINLTYEIAERILVQYTGSPYRTLSDWAKNVKSYHQKFGGLQPKRNLLNIAFIALIRLQKKGYASKDSIGNWKILPVKR